MNQMIFIIIIFSPIRFFVRILYFVTRVYVFIATLSFEIIVLNLCQYNLASSGAHFIIHNVGNVKYTV